VKAKVLPFKIKYVSVLACCEDCCNSWIAHLREGDFERYFGTKRSICPYCKNVSVVYLTREKRN
jgi:hypothetical protein